jgi:Tfp pilus assembly pilus retraction ATPase PilT
VTAQRRLRDAAGTGLVPAVEVISGGLPLWALIRDDQLFQLPALLRRGRAIGMVSLADAIEELVRTGRVAAQDAEPWVVEPPEGATTSRRLLLRPNLRTLLEGER